MTMENDPVSKAINDARALLAALLASTWQELHVVSGGTEIFIARTGGGANPMRSEQGAPLVKAPAAGPETQVKAPHVATLVDALTVGTAVAAGQRVATLRVLDEEEEVLSPISGTIVRLDAERGALVEYAAPLLSIAQAV